MAATLAYALQQLPQEHTPLLSCTRRWCVWIVGAREAMEGCLARESTPADAYRCLNASLCFAVYDVPQCVGPLGFNYSAELFNHTACVGLVASFMRKL